MTKLAQIIYERTLPKILNNIPESERELISQKYKEYMERTCTADIDEPSEDLIEMLSSVRLNTFANQDLDYIKRILIEDKNYSNLFKLNKDFEKYFNENKKIDEEEYQRIKQLIENSVDKVLDFNKKNAMIMADDMLLDLEYLAGKSEDTSLSRLHHFL